MLKKSEANEENIKECKNLLMICDLKPFKFTHEKKSTYTISDFHSILSLLAPLFFYYQYNRDEFRLLANLLKNQEELFVGLTSSTPRDDSPNKDSRLKLKKFEDDHSAKFLNIVADIYKTLEAPEAIQLFKILWPNLFPDDVVP